MAAAVSAVGHARQVVGDALKRAGQLHRLEGRRKYLAGDVGLYDERQGKRHCLTARGALGIVPGRQGE
jgi:hypothetical protein